MKLTMEAVPSGAVQIPQGIHTKRWCSNILTNLILQKILQNIMEILDPFVEFQQHFCYLSSDLEALLSSERLQQQKPVCLLKKIDITRNFKITFHKNYPPR